MEYIDINNFLPAYPSIESRQDDLFNLYPTGFNNSIYRKKEFNELVPDLTKPRINDGKFHAQSQQIYASRYASYHTLTDNQIIIHSMGLGKTALAVLTVETNLNKGFKGALIAVSSKKFIHTFITEIVKLTGKKYFPDNYEDLTNDELKRAIKSKIRKVYGFITFEAFANSISNNPNNEVLFQNQYSDRIIIVDEAHNLRIQPDKQMITSRVNRAFHLLFHNVQNCKILLMTATPMKDRWNEIADLANLILPSDKQLPSGDKFDAEYSNNGEEIKNEARLKEYFKGIISTLRTTPSVVPRDFLGEFLGELKVFKVDVCDMSEHQAKYYYQAYNKDTNNKYNMDLDSKDDKGYDLRDDLGDDLGDDIEDDKGGDDEAKGTDKKVRKQEGVYSLSRQAVNFVFPDGSYGKEGFLRYTNPVKKRERGPSNSLEMPTLKRELIESIIGNNIEQSLQNLSTYSSKYAKTIRNILDQKRRKGGNTFIYNIFVEGSGLILFARILELFGYQRSITGLETTPAPRYVILTNNTLDEGNIVSNVQATVNNPNNATGDYIQVILGSKTAGEGLSFYNVEEIGIHTPYWNYSPIDQAIGRGIRYSSHDVIQKIYENRGEEFRVKIRHYVSVPNKNQEKNSIDYIMYKLSEDKDLRIKRGERFLKSISYDCANNRGINMKGVDGSRDCEYQECQYKCEGIDSFEVLQTDNISFNNFYSEKEVEDLVVSIQNLFRLRFSITLKEIFTIYPNDKFLILKSLKKIIDESISITNMFGFKNYLHEHNDVYYITDSMNQSSSSIESYYTENPSIKYSLTFSEYLNSLQIEKSGYFIESLVRYFEQGKTIEALRVWNYLSEEIQDMFIEICIHAQNVNENVNGNVNGKNSFVQWLLDFNKPKISRRDNLVILKDKCYNLLTGLWGKCDQSILSQVENIEKDRISQLEQNPYGYYGKVNPVEYASHTGWKNGFWIVDSNKSMASNIEGNDLRKKIKGEKCNIGTLTIGKLASIAYRFGLDVDSQDDKGKSISELYKSLEANKHIEMSNLSVRNYQELSETNLRRIYRLSKLKAEILCRSIKTFMEQNNLIIEVDDISMLNKK